MTPVLTDKNQNYLNKITSSSPLSCS